MKMDLKLKKTLTQKQIYSIGDRVSHKIPELLDYFKIEYMEYPNRYSFACPIHGGDNPEGCSIFTDGESNRGNWQCWTHHCEDEYKNTLFGFIRGCLCYQRGRSVSLNETAKFCENFIGENVDDIDYNSTYKQADPIEVFSKKPEKIGTTIARSVIRSKLDIPSKYYINRGFLSSTLETFDVGLCKESGKPMSNRVVVPIYDQENDYVGCAGRSIDDNMKPKWLYSKGFKKCVLYGLNIAKDFILKTQSAILVEGQGDVWRMHEAGYRQAVGIFGCSVTDDQLLLLESSGALNIAILTDSDEAGEKAYKQIVKKCGKRFNYLRPRISTKDVGDMTIEQIRQELDPQLKGAVDYEQ